MCVFGKIRECMVAADSEKDGSGGSGGWMGL